MKTQMAAILFLIAFAAQAAENIPKGTVEVNPKVYPPKAFRRHRQIEVKALEKGVAHPQALPDRAQREALFARVPGLEKFTAKLDELDRDLLYMRAKHGTEADLREKNSDIPPELLLKLRTEARKP